LKFDFEGLGYRGGLAPLVEKVYKQKALFSGWK